MEEKCNLRARSAISSADVRRTSIIPASAQAATQPTAVIRRIDPPTSGFVRKSLPYQPTEKRLFPRLTVYFRQRFRERNFLWAGLHAILGVRAVLDTSVPHHCLDPLLGVHGACGMHVKQPHLAENGRAHEIIVFIHLRTHLQAIPAR